MPSTYEAITGVEMISIDNKKISKKIINTSFPCKKGGQTKLNFSKTISFIIWEYTIYYITYSASGGF